VTPRMRLRRLYIDQYNFHDHDGPGKTEAERMSNALRMVLTVSSASPARRAVGPLRKLAFASPPANVDF